MQHSLCLKRFVGITRGGRLCIAAALAIFAASPAVAAASPWAINVVSYDPGTTAQFGYDNPASALGAPERFTGENEFGGIFAGPVTIFNPAWGLDEIVSIGEGGHLTLELGMPAVDNPNHLHGVDLIIFGNAGFVAPNYPDPVIGIPATLFGAGHGLIELSSDGVHFEPVPGWMADRLFPTQGYLNADAFGTTPGSLLTNFLRPVNPALTLADFDGLTYEQALALYDGSGGGTPIDIALAGLSSVTHVRIRVLDDLDPNTSLSAEIDAIAVVPEPSGLLLLGAAGWWMTSRRRRMR